MINKERILGALTLLALVAVTIGCGTRVDELSTTNVRGIDPKNFDTTCSPCQDFYQYANGTWETNNPVPEEYSNWGTFHEVFERNNEVLKEILDDVSTRRNDPGSVAQKIGDFYSSGMDTAAINEMGAEPMTEDFERIDNISDLADFSRVVSGFHAEGMMMVFDTDAFEDLFNSSMTNLYVTQGGLSLPEKGYYTRDDEESVRLRGQFVQHVANMFELLGEDSATAGDHAQAVMAVELKLAEASFSDIEIRDYPSWYRVRPVSEVKQVTPSFDWDTYLIALGLTDSEEVSYGPEQFFEGLETALTELPLDSWKQYLKWKLVTINAFYLGEAFDKEDFAFFSTTLSGTKERNERWKRILNPINGFMGQALGQLYVERSFPPETKARALAMVANLKTALRERLSQLDWMTEATRAKALEKLEAFGVKIGYPDKWIDYSELEIDQVPFVTNARAGRAFAIQRKLKKVGQTPDPEEWGMNPQTVNAGYNPVKNELIFPAGILQPPFFDGEIDDAVNYGGIGIAIGHEMLHGFDDSGSRFDKDGNMVNWWTDEDRSRFEERTAQLMEQYDAYEVVDGIMVDGERTIGENIADLGGLRMTMRAMEIASGDQSDPMVDGFTQLQRLFLAYAQVWRRSTTPEYEKLVAQSDPHTPPYYRVIGPLANLDEFAEAFGCTDEDKMMRPREERIRIW